MDALLAWLCTRGASRERALAEATVQVTINRQFAGPESKIDNSTEFAIAPSRFG